MLTPSIEQCTFSKSDFEILSHFWYPVAYSHDVQNGPVALQLLDKKLVAYRTSKGVTIAQDLCLHRGVPLHMGWMEGEELVCKYHGFRYSGSGQCVKIPAHPGAAIPPKLCLQTYPAIEKYGLVWTCLDPAAEPILPQLPEWDDPDYIRVTPKAVDIHAAAGRQLEGFLDVSHFAFIHTATFADPSNQVVPRYEVEPKPHGLVARYGSTVSNFAPDMWHRAPKDFLWWRIFEVTFPFSARLTVEFPDNGRLCILNACCPVAARETKLFVPIARNFDKHISPETIDEYNQRIFAEDQEIVERQCPEDLPLDLTEEVHIRADRTSIEYRKGLGKLGLGRSYTT
jgi:vanillate O-demethylase monooxygenase subunit